GPCGVRNPPARVEVGGLVALGLRAVQEGGLEVGLRLVAQTILGAGEWGLEGLLPLSVAVDPEAGPQVSLKSESQMARLWRSGFLLRMSIGGVLRGPLGGGPTP